MLLRQTILYMPAQILGPLAQVVAAIVWTHWLMPGPYGLLTFLVASQDLAFLICMSWWTHFTLRYLAALEGPERESFVRSEASVYLFTFGAQIVLTLLVLIFLEDAITIDLTVAAIVCVGTRSLLTHLSERARVQSRIGVYTFGQFAGSILGFALAYASVVLVKATPAAVLWGFAMGQLVGVVVMWRRLGVVFGYLLPRKATLAAAFAYGAPLLVAGGLAWIAMNGIRVVVEKAAGTHALGLIAVGWGLGQRLSSTLAMLVIAASFPLAVKNWRSDARGEAYSQLRQGGVLLMGLIVPASIGLCFLAGPFVGLAVAAPFREMTVAVLPYAAAAGAIRNIRMHIADPVFLLLERPRINTAINLLDAVCILVGCLAGLKLGGLVGAVAGCLVATIVTTAATLLMAWRLGDFTFPYLDVAKIVVASATMAIGLVVVPWGSLHIGSLTQIVLETILGAGIYAVGIAFLYPAVVPQLLREVSRRVSAAF